MVKSPGERLAEFKVFLGEQAAESVASGEGLGDWKNFLKYIKEEIEVWLDAA